MKSIKSFLLLAATFALPVSTAAQARLPVLRIDGKENPDVYLQSLDIQVEITGSIASTRHTMVFKNRANRILEGMLTFPLPDGRAVTYYALDIDGKMREAVPVEKAMGTQVFEEFEQRRIDPGLLERVEGNNFRTRIYPIPANGTRTIAIGYEEELPLEKGELRYSLPMDYPDAIEKFSVKATVWMGGQKSEVDFDDGFRFDAAGENYVASFSRENYRPARALKFSLPAPADIPRVLMQPAQGSYYFLASVAPELKARKKQWSDTLAIVRDVSLSGSQRDLKRELDMLNIIFAEKKDVSVHLYYLNNRLKKIVNKNINIEEYKVANGKWDELKKTLAAATFDGGTDFSQIKLDSIAGNEILFFSDGISTLGDADFLKNINTKAARPIHCIVSSAKADYSAMRLIALKTGGKFININALSPEKLKTELLNETPLFLGAEHGKTIREVYPGIAMPLHGNFSAAGISAAKDAELTLLFGYGNSVEKRITVKLDAKNAGNKGNAYKIWAQKKIAELDLEYEKNQAELTELGRRFGIVTRNTSLIVLETLGDYIRYGIAPPPELRMESLPKGSAGTGGSGWDIDRILSGTGGLRSGGDGGTAKSRRSTAGIGYGARYGSGFGGGGGGIDDLLGGLMGGGGGGLELKKRREPQTASPDITLVGGRNRESIQRVIVQNMTALRYAYNKRLRKKPDLEGTVTVKFAIDEFGEVLFARVEESTINDAELEATVLSRVKSWHFGKINNPGDVTEVIHPFDFYTMPKQTRISERETQIMQEKAEARRGSSVMLALAAEAAKNIGNWWNAEFTNPPSKYPMPDSRDGAADSGIARGVSNRNSPYMARLALARLTGGGVEDDYQGYLKIRADYANTPAFYFDMANRFYESGDKETALRVLTSIADLELENASLYRLLGYRFKEYGEYALEKFVCKKVIEWRPMEPQSYRDYALALADNGEAQAALDSLCSLLAREYAANIVNRSRGLEEAVVTEINRLIAQNPKINLSKVDKRLLTGIAVDVRVVINWNMNSTDIDLHVIDPNGEECSYKHSATKIGGRVSKDIREGYGPEQFLLKNAIMGRYRVFVNYYGDSQVTAAGPSTVMAEIYTKYAGKAETRRVVCLQMSDAKAKAARGEHRALVAEFDL